MVKYAQELLNQYDHLIENSPDISSGIQNYVKLENMFFSYKKKLNQNDILFYKEELPDVLEQIVSTLDEVFSITMRYYDLELYQQLFSDFNVLSIHYGLNDEKDKFPSYINQVLKDKLFDFNYQLLSYIHAFNPKLFPDTDSKSIICISDPNKFYNTLVKD